MSIEGWYGKDVVITLSVTGMESVWIGELRGTTELGLFAYCHAKSLNDTDNHLRFFPWSHVAIVRLHT